MSVFTVAKFAMLSAALPQPALSAQMFMPAVISKTGEISTFNKLVHRFNKEVVVGNKAIDTLTEQANLFYIKLIDLSDISIDKAVSTLKEEELGGYYEACEMLVRAFEIAIKQVVDDKSLPDFVSVELNAYQRKVAKGRSVLTKLNNFIKQLTKKVELFESDIDFQGLKYLAAYTSDKFSTQNFH